MFYDECFNYLFSLAQQRVLQIFSEKLAPFDVTPIQYGVLSYLYQNEGSSAAKLSEHFMVEPSTMTGILDRMEKKNLIIKTVDQDDRRAYKILPSEEGLELAPQLMQATLVANRMVEDVIGAEYISISKKILRKIAYLEKEE